MEKQTYKYRSYEIQVTRTPPFWQAAIYPTKPSLPTVDWSIQPIRAVSARAAEREARRRIKEANQAKRS
jgi:hypothetical protein